MAVVAAAFILHGEEAAGLSDGDEPDSAVFHGDETLPLRAGGGCADAAAAAARPASCCCLLRSFCERRVLATLMDESSKPGVTDLGTGVDVPEPLGVVAFERWDATVVC